MQLPTYRSRSLTSNANTSFDNLNTVRLNLSNIKNDTDENLLQNGDDHHVSPLNYNSTASQGVFARKNAHLSVKLFTNLTLQRTNAKKSYDEEKFKDETSKIREKSKQNKQL